MSELPGIVSTGFLTATIGVTRQTLARLVREGEIPKAGHGKFDLALATQAFIAHRERVAGTAKPTAAEDRLKELRAKEIELRIARDERKLITLAEAIALDDRFVGAFLAELSALPAAVSRDQAIRRQVEDAVFAARERLSKHFGELAHERRTGEPADGSEDDED